MERLGIGFSILKSWSDDLGFVDLDWPPKFSHRPPKSSFATFDPLEIGIDPRGSIVTTLGNSDLESRCWSHSIRELNSHRHSCFVRTSGQCVACGPFPSKRQIFVLVFQNLIPMGKTTLREGVRDYKGNRQEQDRVFLRRLLSVPSILSCFPLVYRFNRPANGDELQLP